MEHFRQPGHYTLTVVLRIPDCRLGCAPISWGIDFTHNLQPGKGPLYSQFIVRGFTWLCAVWIYEALCSLTHVDKICNTRSRARQEQRPCPEEVLNLVGEAFISDVSRLINVVYFIGEDTIMLSLSEDSHSWEQLEKSDQSKKKISCLDNR